MTRKSWGVNVVSFANIYATAFNHFILFLAIFLLTYMNFKQLLYIIISKQKKIKFDVAFIWQHYINIALALNTHTHALLILQMTKLGTITLFF